jgi:lipopolysaccharide/colanic/teichoic acid biosynthesis glycosyltransferase
MKMRKVRYWILAADLLCVLVALGAAFELHYAGTRDTIDLVVHFQAYSFVICAAVAAWTFLYFEMSLDGFKGGWHFPAIFSKVVVAVSLLMVVLLAFAFLTKHSYSRLVLLYFAIFFVLGLFGVRCVVRLLVGSQVRNGADARCVILGNGPIARELVSKIASHPELPFQVVGFLFPGESEAINGFVSSPESPLSSVKTLQVLDLLAEQNVQKLVVAMELANHPEVHKLIAGCRNASIQVFLVPQSYDLYLSKAELTEIDGLPLLSLQEPHRHAISFGAKRALDLVLSLGILVFASPLLAFSAFVLYRRKGKVFRTELRCGKNGLPFRMWRLNVERQTTNPERYESLFLRWSLTELPQLLNVLRGDMSLVGPRPESIERVKNYSDWQRQRLKVRAGVTGLAQVHGLREQHSSEDKARFDLQYIVNWSPFLDLSLILQTMWTLLLRGLTQEPVPNPTPKFRRAASEFVTREVVDVDRS